MGKDAGFSSPAPPVLLKHLHGHGTAQLPNHLDGPFLLMAHMPGRSQKHKRHRAVVVFFLGPGKHQDGVSPGLVMHQVLSGGRIQGRIGLGLPVQQGPAQPLFIGMRVTPPVQHDEEPLQGVDLGIQCVFSGRH
jgi:hypothetical protein